MSVDRRRFLLRGAGAGATLAAAGVSRAALAGLPELASRATRRHRAAAPPQHRARTTTPWSR